MKSSFVAAFLTCYFSLVYCKIATELLVNLSNGSPVMGQFMTSHIGRGIRAFKNIPYAEPPIGDLRFADPVPKAPWSEQLTKSEIIMCPQMENMMEQIGFVGQEDCLYLNVYAPLNSKTKSPLPVMFFIHGGGWVCGTGNEKLYGPDFLLDQEVILVTGNYRLAALGFLTTNTEEFSGNYGMKDQVMILKWIKDNIAQFGGDPNSVTIFGESAGAASVGYHMISSMSKGLFHKAIMQSGSPFDIWSRRTPEQSLGFAVKIFDALGCNTSPGDYKEALKCMREKSAQEIAEGLTLFYEWDFHPLVIFTPVMEANTPNAFLTAQDLESTALGSNVPLMIGHNSKEGAMLLGFIAKKPELVQDFEARFDELLRTHLFLYDRFDKATMQEKVQKVKDFYFNGENFVWAKHQDQFERVFTDHIFTNGIHEVVKRRISNTASTFAYLFNYRGSTSYTDLILRNSPTDVDYGVAHMDELLYLFPLVKNIIDFRIMSHDDLHMRKQMVKTWVQFASTGNPSMKKVQWTPVTQFPIDYMQIGNCSRTPCDPQTKMMSQMQTGFFDAHIQFIQEFFDNSVAKRDEL